MSLGNADNSSVSMFTNNTLLPIRYLNDLLFCERRAALHLLEQIWVGNQFTAEGEYAHRRADRNADLKVGDKRSVSAMTLVSYRLGLVGKADVVEFRQRDRTNSLSSRSITSCTPYPVDFKRGRKRRWDNDEVQLCAQAMCLEEMLRIEVPRGAIYHIRSRHRREVVFDELLRHKTEETTTRLHNLVNSLRTPPAEYKRRCRGCSLYDICMPKAWKPRATAARYLESLLSEPAE